MLRFKSRLDQWGREKREKEFLSGKHKFYGSKLNLALFPILSHLLAVVFPRKYFRFWNYSTPWEVSQVPKWRRLHVSGILLTSVYILIGIPVCDNMRQGVSGFSLNSCVLLILFVVQLVAYCLLQIQLFDGKVSVDRTIEIFLGVFVDFGSSCWENGGCLIFCTTTSFVLV